MYHEETELYYLQSRYYDPEIGRLINADVFYSTGQGFVGNNMFAYCGNNPVIRYDPTGRSFGLVVAIIVTGTLVGGFWGAITAGATGGNILESFVEGCLTGAIGSACGILIPNLFIAVGIAILGGVVVDFSTQATMQYVENGYVDVSKIDYGRVAKTGFLTGVGTAVPALGEGANNTLDAIGTALLWAEVSTVLTGVDVLVTNWMEENKPVSNKSASNGRSIWAKDLADLEKRVQLT